MSGYDGFALAVDTALALGVLLLLARPLRNAGPYTIGDIFAPRVRGAAPRIAAAAATVTVSLSFLVVQSSGAGSATALPIGLANPGAQQACTVFIGVLMVTCTVLGGMKGQRAPERLSASVARRSTRSRLISVPTVCWMAGQRTGNGGRPAMRMAPLSHSWRYGR